MDSITRAVESIKRRIPGIILKRDEPLRNHTTFKVGGPVRVMFFPDSAADLTEICTILDEFNICPLIMGNGSNILADDKLMDLAVINTSGFSIMKLVMDEGYASPDYRGIEVGAGALLSKLAVFAYENGLTGLEFAHGIPGTVGGAVVMNAGAYDGEMKDVVFSTTAYSTEAGEFKLTAAENEFSYRNSRFSRSNEVVLSVILRLQKGNKESIKQRMDELSARRRESQPLDLASGGSTFKRPKEGYAAALIEQAGLKGYTTGGAQVSEKHSGFVVNNGSATFSDIMMVIEHVQNEVFKQFGIRLEPEIIIVR